MHKVPKLGIDKIALQHSRVAILRSPVRNLATHMQPALAQRHQRHAPSGQRGGTTIKAHQLTKTWFCHSSVHSHNRILYRESDLF